MKQDNHFYIITSIYTGILIISNILANKLINVFGITLPCAIIVFPLVYILSDLITEVYGIKLSITAIRVNLWMNIVMSAIFIIAMYIPPSALYQHNNAYIHVLGSTNRAVVASITAYLLGDLANSISLSVLKRKYHNNDNRLLKSFFFRSISSSMIGQIFDTGIFLIIMFIGVIPLNTLLTMIIVQYIFKILYELICFPITNIIVNKWKKFEGIDTIDSWKGMHIIVK